MSDDKSPLWVVTSYFNPSKFKQRYENFQTFRRFLKSPLLVVELERNGDFQLTQSDGDIVLQLTGEDRIWQKERLLNIGIEHLPDHVEYVAWVDCDVVFTSDDWPDLAVAHLEEEGGVLQLFEEAHHLTQTSTQTAKSLDQLINGEAFFSQIAFARNTLDSAAYFAARQAQRSPKTSDSNARPPKAKVSTGMAWAARRYEIQTCGIYDRGVIGSGDAILVCTLRNWLEELLDTEYFGAYLRQNAIDWAENARKHVRTNVGALPTGLVHLWHGEFQHRNYRNRHKIPVRNGYDPEQDIQLAANGTWEWSHPRGRLAQDVAAYFASRREDG